MWDATVETLYMTGISLIATFILGILLGLLLYLTGRGNLWANRPVNAVIAAYVNITRSIPFVILLILIIPLTKFLVGTFLGPTAALPALIIGAAPFYARMVEIALREIDRGVVEAAQSMGASSTTIIFKVLLPESTPALISGITVTTIAMIGYTAMAGIVGGGGLGTLAYQEGFQRGNSDVTLVATIVILLVVFIVQWIGDFFTYITDKR
ncbi:ABC transporter permease [Shouchella plakortidis]|uniref:ABC transporter permease n=2 Tax=Alkalicoccobacillus plakortidis TaxID=444060 RepID=A0ABT0XHY6_9BACI|nr:ABC transporter permease [Alkalicoccobacillus plakortidis]